MREAKQSGGRVWKIVAVILVMLMVLPVSATATEIGSTAFTAYRASVVPTIDGKISPGEWGDAEPYYYHFDEGNNVYYIRTDGNLSGTLCLKHDSQWLYFLFVINDDEDDISIYNYGLSDSLHISSEKILILSSNGSAFLGFRARPGVYPTEGVTDGSIVFSSTYRNQTRVFEGKMKLISYFSGTDPQAFSIEYTDAYRNSSSMAYLYGYERTVWFPVNQITFSPNHYAGEETIYDIMSSVYNYPIESERIPYSVIIPMTITILASAGILVAIFREIRKKG